MRITEMIADLRLFAACPELERQAVDVRPLVREVVESLRPAADEQQTTLVSSSFNPEPTATGLSRFSWPARRHALIAASTKMGLSPCARLYVTGDPVQLTVAVRALCQNALEAVASSRPGGSRGSACRRRSADRGLRRRAGHFARAAPGTSSSPSIPRGRPAAASAWAFPSAGGS